MNYVRITVLKTTVQEDLIGRYGAPGLTACRRMREGQVFHSNTNPPTGFCPDAWRAIQPFVFTLAHTPMQEVLLDGAWVRKPGVAICSCSDGLRPVIFRLEATDRPVGDGAR